MGSDTGNLFVVLISICFVTLVFGVPAAIVGYRLLKTSFSDQKRMDASKKWPTTPGTITRMAFEEQVSQDTEGERQVSHHMAVEYEYTVDGLTYTGDKYTLGAIPKAISLRRQLELQSRYPVGGKVPVYYDPTNPGEACLMRETPLYNLTMILGFCLFGILACGGCLVVLFLYRVAQQGIPGLFGR